MSSVMSSTVFCNASVRPDRLMNTDELMLLMVMWICYFVVLYYNRLVMYVLL